MSDKTVVLDSSVWVELLANGKLARPCERERAHARTIIVPTLVLFEVYRKVAHNIGEDVALSAIAMLSQHCVEDLTREVALNAADLSLHYRLATADSIVLAHARQAAALLITLDNDFANVPGAKVLR